VAEAACGVPGAAAALDELHRGQLFVERRADGGGEAVYEYHPLFREFLQGRAAATLDPAALAALRGLSARLAAEAGEPEAAGRLYAANADWDALLALVRREGPAFAAHDRHGPLATLIELAPAPLRERDPWLLFWHAWCRISRGEDGWRAPLERSFARFAETGDTEGTFTACAWLVRTSVIASDAAHWIAVAERLAADHPDFPAPAAEARVLWQFHQVRQFPPHHRLLARWAERAALLVRALDDASLRMRMAAFALSVHYAHGDVRRMAVIVAETHALAARADAPPADRLALATFRGYYFLQVGDLESAAAALAAAEALAAETGLAKHLATAWHLGTRLALCAGELARARAFHERLEGIGEPLPPYPSHIATHAVYLGLAERDFDRALATARAVLIGGDAFPPFRPAWRANLGQVLLERGEPAAAAAEIEAALADARALGLAATECGALLLRAAAQFQLGESEAAHASLREALGLARAAGCVPQLPFILPATLARLAARALERGVEREFVTDLVARWRLAPPSPDEERWPWRIRVRALGAFDLSIDGAALNGTAKIQRKPVELLKCVIAFGGRDVAAAAVTQALWPEADGDAAKRSFDVTLHRLRRLLGRDDALALEAGKLALNPDVVWVDCAAFERLAARADEALRGGMRAPSVPTPELIDRVLRLYRGPLLVSDDETWTQAPRERLRHRYLALVERAGEWLERNERADAALAGYQRAVDVDPPAERIYQRIMRILHARGRRAEALEVYRRCREILAATLGALPSSETEALHQQVRGG
jgi:DNA-binding SARP family transcriptional activator